jgi:iron complex outermembrane recepter protein
VVVVLTGARARAADGELEEIVVTAGLRTLSLKDVPASVTVLDSRTVRDAGVQHFEELLPLVPNLNFSGGSSRPRYFQIRGIGELDQYQGAPNPSVGFLIDDIDFSGVGMPATLFDTHQVEVLRGPQGTRYGANALAGLIAVNTADASPEWTLRADASLGDDSLRGVGAVLGGPVAGVDGLAFRLVAQRERSDGFRRDVFLGRSDTNARDESTYRAKLRWHRGDDLDVKLTGMLVDIDDGYDAFAIDNSFTTRSDQPGRDSQRSAAGALRVEWQALRAARLVSISSYARSNIVSSFDGDWGNNPGWAPYAPYQYFSSTLRKRSTLSQDLRLVSDPGRFAWVAGLYVLRLTENNAQHDQGRYLDFDPLDNSLDSRYRATNTAAYAQADAAVASVWHLSAGLRAERRQAHYNDTSALAFDPRDTMVGGQISLRRDLSARSSAYVALSRGYKAGGFNIGTDLDPARRSFAPEYLWNAEIGLHQQWADARLSSDVTLFYARRRNQQVSTSYQAPSPTCPNGTVNPDGTACVDPLSFVYYTDNAASGLNYGAEAALRWQATQQFSLDATLGLLRTRYEDYFYGDRNLSGRDQSHAPRYDFSVSAIWRHPSGWYSRADWSGKDSFYFDASNDQRSSAYQLLNWRIGFEAQRWSASLWAHNVFNRRYAVRGFYFVDEPPDFPTKLYVRWGDPRQVGVTASYHF